MLILAFATTEPINARQSNRLLRDLLVRSMEDAAILTLIGQRRLELARARDDLEMLEREMSGRRSAAT